MRGGGVSRRRRLPPPLPLPPLLLLLLAIVSTPESCGGGGGGGDDDGSARAVGLLRSNDLVVRASERAPVTIFFSFGVCWRETSDDSMVSMRPNDRVNARARALTFGGERKHTRRRFARSLARSPAPALCVRIAVVASVGAAAVARVETIGVGKCDGGNERKAPNRRKRRRAV